MTLDQGDEIQCKLGADVIHARRGMTIQWCSLILGCISKNKNEISVHLIGTRSLKYRFPGTTPILSTLLV